MSSWLWWDRDMGLLCEKFLTDKSAHDLPFKA